MTARTTAAEETSMPCPRCGREHITALPDSDDLVAWFRCDACQHFWSVRVRAGHLDLTSIIAPLVRGRAS